MKDDLVITVELEPIVKVTCKAFECKHNLIRSPLKMAACNLKYITIGLQVDCLNYEPRKKIDNAG